MRGVAYWGAWSEPQVNTAEEVIITKGVLRVDTRETHTLAQKRMSCTLLNTNTKIEQEFSIFY